MQLATFYPDRIVIKSYKKKSIIDVYDKWIDTTGKQKSLDNLKKQKSKLELSKSSKRNISRSFLNLFFHSKARTVKFSSNKFIYNYKASFITLTLPSEQKHDDVVIKERLNVFLQLLRSKYDVKNYVWKAELQKNKNIHFHLIIDKYVNYGALKYYWNKAIKPLGYIDGYCNKFKKMSLNEYVNLRSKNCDLKRKKFFESYKKAYFKGVETGWRSPNSVDVVSIKNSKSLGYYLAKYVTKDLTNPDDVEPIEIDIDRVSKFGKIWSRSQSLSRLKFINKIEYSEIKEIIKKLKTKGNCIIDKYYDYCRVIYLKLENCPKWFKQLHTTILKSLAEADLYPFPT